MFGFTCSFGEGEAEGDGDGVGEAVGGAVGTAEGESVCCWRACSVATFCGFSDRNVNVFSDCSRTVGIPAILLRLGAQAVIKTRVKKGDVFLNRSMFSPW